MTKTVSNYSIRKMLKWAIDNDMPPVYVLNVKDVIKAFDDEWITMELWIDFIVTIRDFFKLDTKTFSFHVNSFKYYDNLQIGLMRALPISVTQTFVTKHIKNSCNNSLNVNIPFYSEKDKKVVIETIIDKGMPYSKDACEYNKGAVLGMLYTKGYREVTVEEPECISNGGSKCIHIFQWHDRASFSYFHTLKDLMQLFLNTHAKIPDYVFAHIKTKPKTIEDLDEFIE